MYFRYFVIISIGIGSGHLFEQTCVPFTQVCLNIDQVILEKNVEVNENDDKTDNDDGQISIRKARLSFRSMWAKNGWEIGWEY